jgi:hypothetical protein
MVITDELFAAYLNCPTKAYLMSSTIQRSELNLGGGKRIFKIGYDNKE